MNRTIGLISTNYSVPGFGSVTEVRPAASIPFGGRYRLLDFALSNMVNSRIQTVGLVTPYFYRSIMDHVGAGKPWDLSRKEGGLYILPGTVFGFHEENARFLFRDLLHNLEYLRQGDGDYILVSSGTLVANIDYQPMITKHELEGKPVTLLYKKMQPGEKRPGRYLTLDGDTVAGIRRADEGENLLLDSFIADKSFLLRMARDYAALDYMDFLDILAHVLPEVAVGCCAFDGYVAFMDGMEDYFRASLDYWLLRHQVFFKEPLSIRDVRENITRHIIFNVLVIFYNFGIFGVLVINDFAFIFAFLFSLYFCIFVHHR